MIRKIFLIFVLLIFLIECVPLSILGGVTDKNNKEKDLLISLFLINSLNSIPRSCSKRRLNPSNGQLDPLFSSQWTLQNTGNFFGVFGMDANVIPAWNAGTSGNNIQVTIIDDGVDLCHEDLMSNVDFSKTKDFTGKLPVLINGTRPCEAGNACHGTAVAGIIGAVGDNGIGIKGIAHKAKISGRNLLLSPEQDFLANIVSAMEMDGIHISNNSWGARDSTGKYDNSLATQGWKDAISEGITSGRNGKGALYFWAGGNGGSLSPNPISPILTSWNNGIIHIDNSNYDGQANNPMVFAICAVGNDGKQAYYSERGANLLVCGYSEGDNGIAVTTTDMMGNPGYNFSNELPTYNLSFNNNYTNLFNGTSAATPSVAGVAALILEANPNLSWREVRYILAKTAQKVDFWDAEWVANNATPVMYVNHKYGFGAVDAAAAVNMAKNNPPSFGPQIEGSCNGSSLTIPTDTNSSPTFATSTCNISSSGINKIESVEVTVSFNSNTHIGDLDLRLECPTGTTKTMSRLSEPHPCLSDAQDKIEQIACNTGAITWTYSTLRCMDEPANGTWTLKVVDRLTAPILNTGTYIASDGSQLIITNSANHMNTGAAITSWSIKVKGRQ